MKLLYEKKAIRGQFPERQFVLGEYVVVRTGSSNDLKYHYGMRVVNIINERIYEVQDQITGNVYETDIEEMYLDCSKSPAQSSRPNPLE
jgi:hypothetical protein